MTNRAQQERLINSALDQVVLRSLTDGEQSKFLIRQSTENDDGNGRGLVMDRGKRLEPVTVGHVQVQQDHVDRSLLEFAQQRRQGGGNRQLETHRPLRLQHQPHQPRISSTVLQQ